MVSLPSLLDASLFYHQGSVLFFRSEIISSLKCRHFEEQIYLVLVEETIESLSVTVWNKTNILWLCLLGS